MGTAGSRVSRGARGAGKLETSGQPTMPLLTMSSVRRVEELTGYAVSHQRVETLGLIALVGYGAVPAPPASDPESPGAHVAAARSWDSCKSGLCVPLV